MAPSGQKLWKCEKEYYEFCREERNIAAILYHALLLPGNLEKFLGLIGWEHSRYCENASIYFEYSYLRDFWNKIECNDEKKCRILNTLNPPNKSDLFEMNAPNFNQYFGGNPPGKEPSKKIVFPGTWVLGRMHDSIKGNFFLNVYKFRSAFNITPDIVIQMNNQTAVCVEAKFESKESKYPTNKGDIDQFKKRLGYVKTYKQTEIQKYLFEEVLGIKNTTFVLLAQTERKSETHQPLTWHCVFCNMDVGRSPKFVRDWINHLRKPNNKKVGRSASHRS